MAFNFLNITYFFCFHKAITVNMNMQLKLLHMLLMAKKQQ